MDQCDFNYLLGTLFQTKGNFDSEFPECFG